jgi:glycosyltransferase involved in cell wall biosynthesis
MKVLMFNMRPNAMISWGGDTTQVVETQKGLQRLGVCAELAADPLLDLSQWDVVHLFNLQTAENGLELLNKAVAIGKPVALSTIYWDLRRSEHYPETLRFGPSRFYRWLASTTPRVAVALHRMHHTRGRLRRRRAQVKMLQASSVILPNSVAELEILVSFFGLPDLRGRAVIVPNAVSPPTRTSVSSSDQTFSVPEKFVLMAASFHPVKGQARLIEALIDQSKLPVVCVGQNLDETRYGKYCKFLAARRGNTYLLNAVPHHEMSMLYAKARVHVLPSLRESPGLSSLEAASYGANCVVGFHAPISEYFEDDAFVCDPENQESIKQAVLKAWNAPPPTRLRARILEKYTWLRAATETLRGYEFALRTKGAG